VSKQRHVRTELGVARRELAGGGGRARRLEGGRGIVVVHVAVGQRQGADPLRMARRENLRDGAAAVVGDEVDLIEAERVAERLQHRGLGAE
jgi:hypothetical protein